MSPADTVIRDSIVMHLEPYGFQLVSEALSAFDALSPSDLALLRGYADEIRTWLGPEKAPSFHLDVLAVACLIHLRYSVLRQALPADSVHAFVHYAQSTPDWQERTCAILNLWSTDTRIRGYASHPPAVRSAFERIASHYGLVVPPSDAPHLEIMRFFAGLMKRITVTSDDDAWRRLEPEDVGVLVDFAVAAEQGSVFPGKYVPNTILARLSVLHPGALKPYHARIAEAGICYPGVIFVGAGMEARDRLVERIRSKKGQYNSNQIALAFVGDRVAVEIVRPEYALEAGCERTAAGTKRQLYHDDCFELVPVAGSLQGASPVAVITPRTERCPCCGSCMTNLFEFDVRDSVLEFLWKPPRYSDDGIAELRAVCRSVPMCERCIRIGGVLYGHLDASGLVTDTVMTCSVPPEAGEWRHGRLPERRLVMGARRSSPFQAHRFAYGGRHSQIGGFPCWEQDAGFPACCLCQKLMVLVGQVSGSDIEFGDAMYYAFLCPACRVTATMLQQS